MDDIPRIADRLEEKQARELNPLVLAYIGDAVHTLYVRTKVSRNATCKADKLHKSVTSQVKAEAQARNLEEIRHLFYEDEEDIFYERATAISIPWQKMLLLPTIRRLRDMKR